jgi:hypothetical protein
MHDSAVLSDSERAFLEALNRLGVRYLIVGMSAAILQGARGATEDIDLWFARNDDPRVAEAAREAGGFFFSGFGMRPPGVGGETLGDRFDITTHMHGLGSFDEEYSRSIPAEIDHIPIRLLPLAQIITSKRATARPKDVAQIPALEEALAVAEDSETD